MRHGFFFMQDDLQAFRIYEMDKCFDDLQIPCRWVPDAGYGYGYPQFSYYPPSVYYVGAILHRIGFQYIDAVKILFIAGYILSAIGMYLLISELLSSWPGYVASVIYTYVPYKAVEVYVRGAMSEFWSLTFFPLIFWAIYKLITTQKYKYFILFSVFLSFLLTTHNLMSLIFAPIAIIWTGYWMVVDLPAGRQGKKWLKVLWSGLLGIGLASFFSLPVILEKKFVHVESMLGGYFDYRAHFVSLYKLFISQEWGYGSSGFPDEKLNLSVGLIQWILVIVGLFLSIRVYKNKPKLSVLYWLLTLLALFTLFMIHMKSSFIWAYLPVLWWLQFPWRFLSVSIFLASVLGGLSIYFAKRYSIVLGVVVVLLVVGVNLRFFVPKNWLAITDDDKFSGISWQKQMTISIFDYLPIYATLPPINEAPKLPEVLEGRVTFNNYIKGSNFQKGNAQVYEDSLIRLPIFDFPGMQVRINGNLISHVNNDCRNQDFCYGLVTFRLPPGNYDLEVRLTDTIVRKTANIISVLSFVILIWLILKKR